MRYFENRAIPDARRAAEGRRARVGGAEKELKTALFVEETKNVISLEASASKGADEGTSFTLVHRLERPASRPDSAWFGVLEKNEDGLYVPKGETTLVQFGGDNSPKLVDVRVQWTCPETRRRGAWKLRRSSVKERNWAERG